MRRQAQLEQSPSDPSWMMPPQFREGRSGGFFSPGMEAHMKGLFFAVILGIAAFYAASAAALFGM